MASSQPNDIERRDYLKFLGGSGLVGATSMLAGCTGGDGDGEGTTTGTPGDDDEETTAADESNASAGGEMVIGMQADRTDPLWPHWSSDATGAAFMRQMMNTLTYVNADGELEGDLAAGPPETDDAQTYVFKIREGVQFHEPYAREVKAEDVVKNWHAILDPSILAAKTEGSLYEDYPTAGRWPFPGLLWGEGIDSEERVYASGEYEVTFELAKPNAAFPALVSIGQCSIVPMEAYEENPDQIGAVDFGTYGTGAFMYDSGQAGDSYTLTRNPNYFKEGENGQLPYLDSVTFRIIPESSVRVTNLQTGDIHLAETIPAQQVSGINNTDGLRAISKPGASHLEHYMNIRSFEPFRLYQEDYQPDAETPAYGTVNEDGKKMRKALRLATNHEQVIQTKFDGKASPKWAPVPPFDWSYQEDRITKYPYDPEQAQQYLSETGNEGFSFTAWATNQPRFVDTATIVQQTVSQAGMSMEVLPKEKSAVWGPVIGNWDTNGVSHEETGYESHFEDIGSGLDPADYFAQVLGGNGINYCFFGHPESDDLIQRAQETTDQQERKELYGDALEIVTDMVPMNGICWPYVNQGVSESVQNYRVKRSSFRFDLDAVWME
jgi:peptide/nickel transport system substrate-binding protein